MDIRGKSGRSGLDRDRYDLVPGGTSRRELEDPSTSISAPDVVSRTCLRPALLAVPVPSCSRPPLEASWAGTGPSSSLPCSRRLRSRPLLLLSLELLDPGMVPDAEGSGEMPDMLQQAAQQPFPNLAPTYGGLRPCHQKSIFITQSTSGPDVVQIWSRDAHNCEPTNPSKSLLHRKTL